MVGQASAHAVSSKALSGPDPGANIPGLVDGGNFPVVHSPAVSFLGTNVTLVNDGTISDEVVSVVTAAVRPAPPALAGRARAGPRRCRSRPPAHHRPQAGGRRTRAAGPVIVHEPATRWPATRDRHPHGALTPGLRLTVRAETATSYASGAAIVRRSSGNTHALLTRGGKKLSAKVKGGRRLTLQEAPRLEVARPEAGEPQGQGLAPGRR